MSRSVIHALVVASLAGAAAAVAPSTASALCCAAVTSIPLSPAVPRVAPRMWGRVEVNECLGLSFLHIVVRANVPDGTQFLAAFPGAQPLLSDWITIKGTRGDLLWQGVTTFGQPSGGLTGRTMVIMDSNYTTLAQGVF